MSRQMLVPVLAAIAVAATAFAQQNRVDSVTPAAPELASYGKHAIGVRTLQVTETNNAEPAETAEQLNQGLCELCGLCVNRCDLDSATAV